MLEELFPAARKDLVGSAYTIRRLLDDNPEPRIHDLALQHQPGDMGRAFSPFDDMEQATLRQRAVRESRRRASG